MREAEQKLNDLLVTSFENVGKMEERMLEASSNDLSMFQYAVNCIAMGDHSPVLEPYISFVTKTVEDDGIAYAMKELGII